MKHASERETHDRHPYRAWLQRREDAPAIFRPSVSRISQVATFLLLTLVMIGVWLAVIAWRERRLTAAVLALPQDVQEATYRRSIEELSTTCAAHPELAEHCADDARFVLRFPQCASDCQQLARRYFPVVTK